MSRSLHRFLVLAALTLAIAGGMWAAAHAEPAAHAGLREHGAMLALAAHAPASGDVVAVRLRPPTPSSGVTAPHRYEVSRALPSRLVHHTAESPRGVPLYTLLRSFRI